MKLYITVSHGKRGKFWWRLVDKDNRTRALCPSPGFHSTEEAHSDAYDVANAILGDPDGAIPVVYEHHPWWQFWRD